MAVRLTVTIGSMMNSRDDRFALLLAEFLNAYERAGRAVEATPDDDEAYQRAARLYDAVEGRVGMAAKLRARMAARIWRAGHLSLAELGRRVGLSKGRADQLVRAAREAEAEETERKGDLPDLATKPEPQPVVAAIVTSPEGVLITRRKEGNPVWGFVTGEVEPGEAVADAAVREVKEETGLTVRHGRILGRRVHPQTLRTMIYLTAELAGARTQPFVGDASELAAVFWVDLDEADRLMPTMFEPVWEYLKQTLRAKG